MRKQLADRTDEYFIFIFGRLMAIAPITGLIAGVTYTASYLLGHFDFVKPWQLILFDLLCLSYFPIARALWKRGIVRDGEVSEKALTRVGLILDALIVLQWNAISYIFPTTSFWGFAPMFVLISALLFKTRVVFANIGGISVSLIISWIVMGEKLLPVSSDMFAEETTMKVVALAISFSIILILTHYAESFTSLAKENLRDMKIQNSELESMSRDIIDFTADIVEQEDATTGFHAKRLKNYTKILAEQIAADYPEYGLDGETIDAISFACVLHDVGKISIPDSILKKPGKLTPEEFEVIKTHTVLGAKIIDKLPESVGEDYKKYCREICQFHHEKWDGRGYPCGLKGDEIPISAQIVAVADCFDALSSDRPYKKAFPREVAIGMILNGECGQFSDKIMSCLTKCREKLLNC